MRGGQIGDGHGRRLRIAERSGNRNVIDAGATTYSAYPPNRVNAIARSPAGERRHAGADGVDDPRHLVADDDGGFGASG